MINFQITPFNTLRCCYQKYICTINNHLFLNKDFAKLGDYVIIDQSAQELKETLDNFIQNCPSKRILRQALRDLDNIPYIKLIILEYYTSIPLGRKDKIIIKKAISTFLLSQLSTIKKDLIEKIQEAIA